MRTTKQEWYMVYALDIPFGFLSLTVFPPEESRLQVTANLGSRQEIGDYRHRLPAERVTAVREALRAADYQSLPAPAPAEPGTPFVVIGEGVEGSLPEDRSFPLGALPVALDPVMRLMGEVVEEMREHPYRVVEGAAAPESAELVQGEPVAFVITLRNIGTVRLEASNPAGATEGGEVGLRLRIARDVPADALEDADVHELELAPADVRQLPPTGEAARKPAVTQVLAPGEELRLRVQKSLLLPPGAYRAAVTYVSDPGEVESDQFVAGTLTMDLGTFTVVSARR